MFPPRGGMHARPEELFVGRYAVDGALPWGGLATYYRASTEGTPLILCVLPMDVTRSARAEAAFGELAHGLGAAESRALPRVLDAGVIDGVPYLAFQDTRGALLSDVLRDRPLSSLEVLRLADGVLEALETGHANGLVHGDLTPQNIVMTRDRHGGFSPRVIGMGILPLLRGNPDASAHSSHTGSGPHAISYMAPEIFGGGGFEPSVDLYSLGALLHHMVTGSPPSIWETPEGFDDMPGLPDVIRRAMAKRPTARYPNAASMRAALDWLEVESVNRNPKTQDIAPWMVTSQIHARSSHPTGKVLTTSGARPIPIAPIVADDVSATRRQWTQLALLLALLATLVFSGYWYEAQTTPTEPTVPLGLEPETDDAP